MMRNFTEFTEYYTPDGQLYRFDTHDKFLVSDTGYGMPPITYITQKGPNQHGETVIDYRLGTRIVQLVHRRNECDRIGYWDARSELLNFFRPNRQLLNSFTTGVLRKVLPDGKKRDLDVLVEQGPAFQARRLDEWDEFGFMETIRFIAFDPSFYDPNEECMVWELGDTLDELQFPMTFKSPIATKGAPDGNGLIFISHSIYTTTSIVYTGTWHAYPVIQIVGPLNGPSITNVTTGKTIALNYDVSSGETVTITLQYGNKTVVSDVAGSIIGTVTSPSDLAEFRIVPDPEATGGVNEITVFGANADELETEISISYKTRYIGI
jgi:hypothetical protein